MWSVYQDIPHILKLVFYHDEVWPAGWQQTHLLTDVIMKLIGHFGIKREWKILFPVPHFR